MVRLVQGFGSAITAAMLIGGVVEAQSPAPAAPQEITVVGCVTRNGDTDIDKGVRRLDIEPNALALTNARVTGTDTRRSSAVPGSIPDGSNTGTIPGNTIVGQRTSQPDTRSFALKGDRVKALESRVGERVEIVGRLTASPAGTSDQARGTTGTTGTTRGAAPVPGVGTREERPAEPSAHPSAEFSPLEVLSFRGVTGGCQ
jgi:hypothetical protein